MIIFDEKLYAEEMLKKGFKTKHKNVNELKILAKYYFYKELEQDDVKKKIKDFCEKHVEQYNNDEWYKIINNTVIAAKNKPLITEKEVHVTENELDIIKKIEKFSEQKVLFVLLVLYKFYDYKKFEVSIEDIYRLAKLGLDSKSRLKILQNLTKQELIDIDMSGKRSVTFADKESPSLITIRDYDDFIFELSFYNGEDKIIKCSSCKKAIVKTSNRKERCKPCWEIYRKKYKAEKERIYRANKKRGHLGDS